MGWAGVPAWLMFVGMYFLPESPRWTAYTCKKIDVALNDMIRLRGSRDVAVLELAEVEASIDDGARDGLWRRLVSKPVLRALAVGCGLQFIQQNIGINTIMYYSATILQMAREGGGGCRSSHAANNQFTLNAGAVHDVCMTVPVASSQLFGNFVGMALADKAGRRPLVLGSLLAVSISLGLLGYSFFLDEPMGTLALVSMCIYLFTFGMGMACMPWLVNAEIYPLDVRGVANGIATTVNWVSNFVVAGTFLDLVSALSTNSDCPIDHPDGAFWLYAGVAIVGFIFLAWMMPETKGKTLEEIEQLFE